MPVYHSFVHLLFIGIIALFPVVNPVGSAFIITPYFAHLSSAEKRKAVGKITFYAFCICTVSLFAGQWILQLFGISIPIVQLAGGIMICKMGWEFLSSDKQDDSSIPDSENQTELSWYHNIEDKLFYPITFPVTTGAGTISVLFTLSAHSASPDMKDYYLNTGAILLSILFMCLLIYIFYLNTKTLIDYLGSNGEKIVNRVTAFLIFCVGLQIAVTGLKSLFKI
ncbi:MarC family protein [Mucilaginibacter aquaedulcis]|uniref:MarC family protein n=1 Tax=Mucilaginibacter aquaedulcis TaxID=1187081 RepID=UPI0025B55DFA|nr:MarC family protein [Mucilaginibacter aquaedulcis]MDN3550681.1 MarC family protein [Mucilaginibacter aquaedulcis]